MNTWLPRQSYVACLKRGARKQSRRNEAGRVVAGMFIRLPLQSRWPFLFNVGEFCEQDRMRLPRAAARDAAADKSDVITGDARAFVYKKAGWQSAGDTSRRCRHAARDTAITERSSPLTVLKRPYRVPAAPAQSCARHRAAAVGRADHQRAYRGNEMSYC